MKISNIDINEQFKSTFNILEKSNKNIFITGKAGTGKSTLLEYFRQKTLKKIVVLAPTGVAAVNVKGQTIHSFFRFKPDITPETVKSIKLRKSQRQIYKELDMIIIDEISMVRSDLLDCINEFLKIHGKYKDIPFGGIQMVFFGDLYQLSPVVTKEEKNIFKDLYSSPYFFDAKSFEYLKIEFIEFEKIYRQKEENFIKLLSNVRNDTVSYEHLKQLNSRVMPDFIPKDNEFYIYLTTTNFLANRINEIQLNRLKSENYTFDGDVSGNFEGNNLPTQQSLNLKVGSQVMLLNNDPNNRWVNGSIGKIICFRTEAGIIEVELSSKKVVEVTPFTWEMFKFFYNDVTQAIESEVVGSFTQFPLRLAWAVTIHKSQGKTFSKVIIDIGSGTFSHGQLYVALSRSTSFEGLVLKRPILKRHIILDKDIVRFMNNYYENKKILIKED